MVYFNEDHSSDHIIICNVHLVVQVRVILRFDHFYHYVRVVTKPLPIRFYSNYPGVATYFMRKICHIEDDFSIDNSYPAPFYCFSVGSLAS